MLFPQTVLKDERTNKITSYDSSIEFDDEVFLLRPAEDNSSFLSRDKIDFKDVKLAISSNGRFPNKDKSLVITVGPGYPETLQALNESAHLLEVVENESISSALKMACFDFNGNRTGPVGEEKWKVSVGGRNFELDSPVYVNADGSIIITDLRVKPLEGPITGMTVERECVFILEGDGFNAVSLNLRFRISRSRHPVRAKVIGLMRLIICLKMRRFVNNVCVILDLSTRPVLR